MEKLDIARQSSFKRLRNFTLLCLQVSLCVTASMGCLHLFQLGANFRKKSFGQSFSAGVCLAVVVTIRFQVLALQEVFEF